MFFSIKTPEEQQKMREAGAAAASVLVMLEPYVKPGVSTDELNRICHEYIVRSEERRVGKACVRKSHYRWSQYHQKNNQKTIMQDQQPNTKTKTDRPHENT